MKNWLFATLCSLFISPLLADVAPSPSEVDWQGLHASKDRNNSVRMAWEIVDLTPGKEKNLCSVEFAMVNDTDKECTFEVGFPSLHEQALKDFKVMVDGKPQLFKVRKLEADSMTLKVEEEKSSKDNRFRNWLCWDMTFKPKQEVKIVVSYWTEPKALWRHNSGPRYRDAVRNANISTKTGTRWVGYILQTGAGWKGAIGKATVRIHHSEIPLTAFTSKPFAYKGENLIPWDYDPKTAISSYVYTNLNPQRYHDISFEYRISTVKEEYNALLEKVKAGTADDDMREHLKNLVKDLDAKMDKAGIKAEFGKDWELLKALWANPTALNSMYVPTKGNEDYIELKELIEHCEAMGDTATLRSCAKHWKRYLGECAESLREHMSYAEQGGDGQDLRYKECLVEISTLIQRLDKAEKTTP